MDDRESRGVKVLATNANKDIITKLSGLRTMTSQVQIPVETKTLGDYFPFVLALVHRPSTNSSTCWWEVTIII